MIFIYIGKDLFLFIFWFGRDQKIFLLGGPAQTQEPGPSFDPPFGFCRSGAALVPPDCKGGAT